MEKDQIIFKEFYRQRVLNADSRWLICQQCPERVLELCAICGCQIARKVTEIHEACPRGKW